MVKSQTITCQNCKKEFEANTYEFNTGRKYCSRKCSQEGRNGKIHFSCEVCGKKSEAYKSEYNRASHHYCSPECNKAGKTTSKKEKSCIICEKIYTARNDNSKFCSHKCSNQSQRDQVNITCPDCGKHRTVQRAYQYRKFCNKDCMVSYYRKDRIEKVCLCCGENFQIPPSRRNEATYCSQSCAATVNTQEGKIGLLSNYKSFYREDLNQFFRSSWEANYARYLNYLGIDWDFEPKRFKLSNGTHYIPDFRISEHYYIEVKGYFRPEAKRKMIMFKKEYPEIKIEIVDKEFYKPLEDEWKAVIPNWE